jgi:hypothetical protein
MKTDTPTSEDPLAGCSPQLRAVLRMIAEWVVERIDRKAREQAEAQEALTHTPGTLKNTQGQGGS